jgi:hypothetical protein
MERLFWTGQIPNEGPVMKKIQRAVREVERDQKRKNKDNNRKKKQTSQSASSTTSAAAAFAGDKSDDNIVMNSDAMNGEGDDTTFESLMGIEDLPELPRDWKVKLREKVLRNLVASMEIVHIRCEVPEGGLEFVPKSLQPQNGPNSRVRPAEERAFSFGFTIENFVVRTATEDWKVGSHDTRNPVDGSAMSSVKGHLGPNEYVVKNNVSSIRVYKNCLW